MADKKLRKYMLEYLDGSLEVVECDRIVVDSITHTVEIYRGEDGVKYENVKLVTPIP